MRVLFFLLLLTGFLPASPLIPMPREIKPGNGELMVDVQTAVIAPANLASHAEVLLKALQKTTGYVHRSRTPRQLGRMTLKRAIKLGLADSGKAGFYHIEITPDSASITGSDLQGLMHGVQTFVQLLPGAKNPHSLAMIPAQVIEDWPETIQRIFHLDVSGHLFPTADLKTLIDWLSFHKLNELHLQLNGDHGWRMESSTFPRLHQVGSVRASTPPYGDPTGSDSTEYGGYYTTENLRELAAHATARQIKLVPTFTFSTGASAVIAAYPELGKEAVPVATTWEKRSVGVLQNEATLEFLDQLFAEVAEVFPSDTIRLQGPRDPFQEKLKDLLARHDRKLFQSVDLATSDFSVYSRPKEMELLTSIKLTAEDGFNPVRQVYELPVTENSQATLRTRFVPDFLKVQYLAFPRLAAFAEASWNPSAEKNYEEFRPRLEKMMNRYVHLGIQASRIYEKPVEQAIDGVLVTSSLKGRENHAPALIFDGRADTFFWSEEGLGKGDHLTLEFPYSLTGNLTVATGRSAGAENDAPSSLIDGVLELSSDGQTWNAAAEFFEGLVTATVPRGTRFARIRVLSDQNESLVLHEVNLSEPMLKPLHEESRQIKLPRDRGTITLTFKADFREHPEFRDEILAVRETFFTKWLPLAQKLGVSQDPHTPHEFHLKPGEPGNIGRDAAQAWALKRLVPIIQNYPVSSPVWFTTGMASMLRNDLPAMADPSKALEGGPQTAAFLTWISSKWGESALAAISQECRGARYRNSVWKLFTKKSLEDLLKQYQEES